MRSKHIILGLSIMWAVSGSILGETKVSIDSLAPAGDVALTLSGRPPETVWVVENSLDLLNWDVVQPGGIPIRFEVDEDSVSFPGAGMRRFFRAVLLSEDVVPALYNVRILRDLHLTFDEENWEDQLAGNYGTGTNLLADLTVEGVSYPNVGVHYRGFNSYAFTFSSRKKSFAIALDESDPDQRLLNMKTLNLNNAYGDASFMRELIYSNACAEYFPSPHVNFVRLFANGDYFGIYVNVQQENKDLLESWFDNPSGDRWRAGVGTPGGFEGTIDFGGSLRWEGGHRSDYDGYELKGDSSSEEAAWSSLILALNALNHTPDADFPEFIDSVFAVDRWLWAMVLENIFIDEDAYLSKAGDYQMFRDANTGRIHPIQRDGNETFTMAKRETVAAVYGENLLAARPLSTRLLDHPPFRQRYLAHLRTVLDRTFTIENIGAKVDTYASLIRPHVETDPIKLESLAAFDADTAGEMAILKEFVRDRRAFLLADPEVNVPSPHFISVSPDGIPVATTPTPIQASFNESQVTIAGANLYYAVEDRNRGFTMLPMIDNGGGAYSAELPAVPGGTRIHYYVEGMADDLSSSLAFYPARAEAGPLSILVMSEAAETTPVVINEFMASNSSTIADPQGQFDDWIELRNLTAATLDVGGMFLSDKPANPRKWEIPAGSTIEAGGYLLIWADEDGADAPGLHANFKLSADGETLLLIDTDAGGNELLDTVDFGLQQTDVSTGRPGANPTIFSPLDPTPGSANPE
jgi:spore coat protein CotH